MHSRAIFSAVAALVFASLMHSSSAADDAVTLAWKFKKGEKLHYVIQQNSINDGKFGGQSIKSETKQTLNMEWNVDEVDDDGTAEMTQTITRARLKVTAPGLPAVDYDSASEEAPKGLAAQFAAAFKALVGKKVKLKMSPQGTISDVKIPEGLADELKKAGGPGPAAAFDEESFKQMTGNSTLQFADHPVKKGDTWQHKTTMSNAQLGAKQTTEITYTYQGTEKKDGKQIDNIEMTMKAAIAPPGAGGPQIEIKDQQSSGTIEFDHKAGRVIKSQANGKMTMAINIMGTKIDQSVTNEAVTHLTDGKEAEESSDDEK